MARFQLVVRPCMDAAGNFLILGAQGEPDPTSLLLNADGRLHHDPATETVLLRATVSWGRHENPLLAALPR